jgi:hypothetical protein
MQRRDFLLGVAAAAGLASRCARPAPGGPSASRPMVGVKIYEYMAPLPALFDEWRRVGINTVFASVALNSNTEFQALARRYEIPRFIIFPTFMDTEALKADPALYAITDRGKQAIDDWVTFVCPSREAFRRGKVEGVRTLVRTLDPDGMSIDFIRHFVFWEMVHPDRTLESIANTCFCDSCMQRFQTDAGVTVPASAKGAMAVAAWIKANHQDAWVAWKCGLITSLVKEMAEAARQLKAGIRINLHAVPWRQHDFGGAVRIVAGQDLTAMSAYADYVSPMTYHHMVRQNPAWVHSVVEDIASRVTKPVLPSIQVGTAYRTEPLPVEEFSAALGKALEQPSQGVVFWSWPAFEKEPAKKEALRAVTARL